MNELEKKLIELQKQGFETISIIQVRNWMSNIRREATIKRIARKELNDL